MHDVHSIKRGDTRPLDVTLRDQRGAADLANVTEVRFNMTPIQAGVGSTVTLGVCAVLQTGEAPNFENKGKVRYSWDSVDVDTPGLHNCEWQVTFIDGTIESWPNGSDGIDYFKLEIIADLA